MEGSGATPARFGEGTSWLPVIMADTSEPSLRARYHLWYTFNLHSNTVRQLLLLAMFSCSGNNTET